MFGKIKELERQIQWLKTDYNSLKSKIMKLELKHIFGKGDTFILKDENATYQGYGIDTEFFVVRLDSEINNGCDWDTTKGDIVINPNKIESIHPTYTCLVNGTDLVNISEDTVLKYFILK